MTIIKALGPIHLRYAKDSDHSFLLQLFSDVNSSMFELMPLTSAQKNQMLNMQFNAQNNAYIQNFPHADHYIIMAKQTSVGQIAINRQLTTLKIINIALLQQFRGQGIGTLILKQIIAEAKQCQCDIELSVDLNNPAQILYETLGFESIGQQGAHSFMLFSVDNS